MSINIVDSNEFHPLTDAAAYGAWSPAIILRATYGTSHVDNNYAAERALLAKTTAVQVVGHYGYVVASEDAAAQGTFFAQTVLAHGGLPAGHFIAWDIEEGTGDQTARANAWMNAAQAVLHNAPAAEFGYSGAYFWAAHLGTVNNVHRWIASYGSPSAPAGADLWQFTDAQNAPGVSGPCDCSVFNGTLDQLKAMIGVAPQVAVASTGLAKPVVGGAIASDGNGYWLTAGDGGIFNYGDAGFHGSLGSVHLAAPVVGMAATPTGNGYWLVGADGGVFCFGDATFHGSAGGIKLAAPVVGILPSHTGNGYALLAADGGVFCYGDFKFYGSVAK